MIALLDTFDMIQLQRGQRLKLAQISASKQLIVGLNPVSPTLQFDISCFGLDKEGQLSDDRFFVFYNQKKAPRDAIKMLGAQGSDRECFWLDLNQLPASIHRLVWVVSIDGAGEMKHLGDSHLRFLVGGEGTNRWQEGAKFNFSGRDFGAEKAIMVAELYLKDEWRLNAVGQGFAGGLDAVLTHFGGEANDDVTPIAPPPMPQRLAPPAPQPLRPAPLSASPASTPSRGASLPPRQPDGKHCTRCGAAISFWDKTRGRYNAATGRCADCEAVAAQALRDEQERANRERMARDAAQKQVLVETRESFLQACAAPTFNGSAWRIARHKALNGGLSPAQVLQVIRPDALQFLETLVDQSAADGIITAPEDALWKATLRALELPLEWTQALQGRWEQEKTLSSIRQGNLPSVQADFHLESDEICHLLISARFLKETKTTSQHVPVKLAATSKKFYVLEPGAGGKEISYAKFLRVLPSTGAITLELSVRSGAGTYLVDNSAHVDAVLTTLVRISKRHLVQQSEQGRSIPQAVKTAVWQRDGGKCVQCGAQGRGACLEYDHDIPFSRGGASTVANLQLLCRRCNLDKSNRV